VIARDSLVDDVRELSGSSWNDDTDCDWRENGDLGHDDPLRRRRRLRSPSV
jgi:hypothetical protein